IGMIAPDDTTYAYLDGRKYAPTGAAWDKAMAYWKTLPSDPGAAFAKEVDLDVAALVPMVSWGTNPEDSAPITGRVPDPSSYADPFQRKRVERALAYMK